jgi:hypothetical protein
VFCEQCGKELPPGQKFCTSCGAEKPGAGAGPAAAISPPCPPKGGMKSSTRLIVGLVLALIVIGAVVGVTLAFVGGPAKTNKPKPNTLTGGKPTTEKVAFISGKEIYSINLDGTGKKRLTSTGNITDFAVSTDGTQIAYVSETGNAHAVWLMSTTGTGVVEVTKPGAGQAENPAFDPSGRYVYYTLVTPQTQSDIEASRPFSVAFERYDISSGTTKEIYVHRDMMEQSINGLYADPGGDALYFNLYGSDWPSSVPYKLELGPIATETVYMPMLRDSGVYTAVAYRLTGFSRKGYYISYFKDALIDDPAVGSEAQEVDACYQTASLSGEVSVAGSEMNEHEEGRLEGIEFSSVADAVYFYGKVSDASGDGTSVTLDFYRGAATSSAKPVRTPLGITVQKDQGLDVVWHMMPVAID